MNRVMTGHSASVGHTADRKVLYFSSGRGGVLDGVAVYFGVPNCYDVSDDLVDANARIASDFLDAEVVAGNALQARYELQDGKMSPL